MPVVVVAAAVAVACSVPLLWWSLAPARVPQRAAVLRNLAGLHEVTDLRQVALQRSARDRALRPMLRSAAGVARRLTPAAWIDALDRRITLAGRPAAWPLERVLAAKVLFGLAGAALGTMVLSGRGGLLWTMFALATTALGYFSPDLLLYGRGQERQQKLQQELPDTLDQLTISVEAGLGFESALARAARTGKGPLAQEFMRTLQDMQIGASRAQAFRGLADRTNVADLRHFVLAVVQAEAYGIPVADVLRTQASEQRIKRRQRAEERAMKVPVKVIFPLVLCILPTLFVVLLGPAGIRMFRAFTEHL